MDKNLKDISAKQDSQQIPNLSTKLEVSNNPDIVSISETVEYQDLLFKISNIDHILSKVFQQMNFRTLLIVSTICHRWNNIVAPYLCHSIAPFRPNYVKKIYHGKVENQNNLRDLEANACIEIYCKYSHLVRRARITQLMRLNTVEKFFNTFDSLVDLILFNFDIFENWIISCLRPLKALKYLKLNRVNIKPNSAEIFQSTGFQFTTSLTKITLINVAFQNNAQLFKQSLISVTTLTEIILEELKDAELVTPLIAGYPRLKSLTLLDNKSLISEGSINQLVKSNPQIVNLSLQSKHIGSNMMSFINANFKALKILSIVRLLEYPQREPIIFKFSYPMALESLTLHALRFSVDSIVSILKYTTNLKSLSISVNYGYDKIAPIIHSNFPNLTKLALICELTEEIHSQYSTTQYYSTHPIKHALQGKFHSVKKLILDRFNISKLNIEYLNQFPNLQLLEFYHFCTLIRTPNQINKVNDQLKKLDGWEFDTVKNLNNDVFGYLRKPGTRLPFSYLSPSKFKSY